MHQLVVHRPLIEAGFDAFIGTAGDPGHRVAVPLADIGLFACAKVLIIKTGDRALHIREER